MGAQSENPFTLRVFQVMTGFGAGCGIGLGVGYPISTGSIPVVGDLLNATSNAGSRAFGGVGHKAFGMLRKLGIKNLEAGVGCGIGIGHGFGVGIALKPGVSEQFAHSLQGKLSAVASQLKKLVQSPEENSQGSTDKLPPGSTLGTGAGQLSGGNILEGVGSEKTPSDGQIDGNLATTSESLSQSSAGKPRGLGNAAEAVDLQLQNEILRTLLRHQELFENLKLENEAIRQGLSDQLDTSPDENLQTDQSGGIKRNQKKWHFSKRQLKSGQDCFDCRIAARRRW